MVLSGTIRGNILIIRIAREVQEKRKMEELVSVIVPVYNVEKYLDECITSIVSQTYKNLEIILVDDGSTDCSGKKCDEWKDKDDRIIVVHQENKGVSAARNMGLFKSMGQWIAFVDSDDYVEKNYIEKLLLLNKKWETYVSCCQRDGQELYVGNDEQCIESKLFLLSQCYRTALWYYLYKKELFEGILFPEGKVSEDVAVLYKIIYRAKKVAVTSDVLYHYRIRKGSLSNKEQRITQCDIDRIDILKEKAFFFEQKNEQELAETAWKDYLTNILILYGYRNENTFEINKAELIKNYRKNFVKIWKSRVVPWKLRIILWVSYIIPDLGGRLLK